MGLSQGSSQSRGPWGWKGTVKKKEGKEIKGKYMKGGQGHEGRNAWKFQVEMFRN